MIAFELDERGIPRQGYDIVDGNGHKIGEVTSGTMGPAVGKAIGMGYSNKGHNAFDTEDYIKVGNKLLKAKIVKLPFYKN